MTDGLPGTARSRVCATLFGKLPLKRDFVRLHHDYPEALAFDTWLAASLADLAQRRIAFGELRARFLFALPLRSLVGVFGPSRDRAGRAFPVSVFAPVPSERVTRGPDVLWLACEPFFSGAEVVLQRAQGAVSLAEIEAQLWSLQPPRPEDLEARRQPLRGALVRAEVETERLPGAADLGGTEARPIDPCGEREGRCWLACPVDSAAQAGLAIARTQAGARRGALVSVLWSPPFGGDPGRILTCLGPAPIRGLGLLKGRRAGPHA